MRPGIWGCKPIGSAFSVSLVPLQINKNIRTVQPDTYACGGSYSMKHRFFKENGKLRKSTIAKGAVINPHQCVDYFRVDDLV
jgi:hypothetical protein